MDHFGCVNITKKGIVKMKKFLSVILATAILFSLCISSAFATIDLTTNDNWDWSNYYGLSDQLFSATGWAKIEASFGRSIDYGVTLSAIEEQQVTYNVNIQCAATYASGGQDYDSGTGSVSFDEYVNAGTVFETLYLPYYDTLINVDAEFRVGSAGDLKWLGFIYQTYTPGIDT